jgi:hypothetical protein
MGSLKKSYFIDNIYLKCNISDKRRLWESLSVLKATFGEEA